MIEVLLAREINGWIVQTAKHIDKCAYNYIPVFQCELRIGNARLHIK